MIKELDFIWEITEAGCFKTPLIPNKFTATKERWEVFPDTHKVNKYWKTFFGTVWHHKEYFKTKPNQRIKTKKYN